MYLIPLQGKIETDAAINISLNFLMIGFSSCWGMSVACMMAKGGNWILQT